MAKGDHYTDQEAMKKAKSLWRDALEGQKKCPACEKFGPTIDCPDCGGTGRVEGFYWVRIRLLKGSNPIPENYFSEWTVAEWRNPYRGRGWWAWGSDAALKDSDFLEIGEMIPPHDEPRYYKCVGCGGTFRSPEFAILCLKCAPLLH